MKADIVNFNNEIIGTKLLNTDIFNLKPRGDIIKLVIDWQMTKKMTGTHATKTISQVSGTTKKPFKQKGTGNARQGSLRSVQMRGGGVIHGPVVRSHATKLPKKIRKLGLKHALSAKFAQKKIVILESLILEQCKTSILDNILQKFNVKSLFVIGGDTIDRNFIRAAQNIPNVVVVPQIGANVYDIINHDCLFLSQDAVDALEKRLQ